MSNMYATHVILVLGLVMVTSSALIKRRMDFPYENLEDKDLFASSKDVDQFNKLVMRLIDAAIDDAKERGTNDVIVDEMMRKRSSVRRCFFHAVNCW